MDYDKTWHRIIDVITSAVLVILTSKCTSTLNGVFMKNENIEKIHALVTFDGESKCKFIHFCTQLQWAVEVTSCTPKGEQEFSGTHELWFPVPTDSDITMVIEAILVKHKIVKDIIFIECIRSQDLGNGRYCDDFEISFTAYEA